MPKKETRIALSEETRDRLNIYKALNKFKSHDKAVESMLNELEKRKVKK